MQGYAHPALLLSAALDVPEEQADAIENAGRYLVGADQRIVGIVKAAVIKALEEVSHNVIVLGRRWDGKIKLKRRCIRACNQVEAQRLVSLGSLEAELEGALLVASVNGAWVQAVFVHYMQELGKSVELALIVRAQLRQHSGDDLDRLALKLCCLLREKGGAGVIHHRPEQIEPVILLWN